MDRTNKEKTIYRFLYFLFLIIVGVSLSLVGFDIWYKATEIEFNETAAKYCDKTEDCVPVWCSCHCSGCGGFYYDDIVNKAYVDKWYVKHRCKSSLVCTENCCSPVFIACENNTCIVKPKTRENMPKELLEEDKKNEELCNKEGGTWISQLSELGNCNCPQHDQVDSLNPELYHELGKINFVVDRGCVSSRELCEENMGVWEKPEVWLVEKREDIPKNECVISLVYTFKKWDEERNVCILSRFSDPNPKCIMNKVNAS